MWLELNGWRAMTRVLGDTLGSAHLKLLGQVEGLGLILKAVGSSPEREGITGREQHWAKAQKGGKLGQVGGTQELKVNEGRRIRVWG